MSAVDPRLRRWNRWLSLSATPVPERADEALLLLSVRRGTLLDSEAWPEEVLPRIYVAVDDAGPVYVGQTSDRLDARIRRHFSSQATRDQRVKAGTWRGVASASFPLLAQGELSDLERRAADWVLPVRHRRGRRHPRSA
ncbi:hypothetical protein GCM10008944_20680 [Cytobacillus oceanisediminis]